MALDARDRHRVMSAVRRRGWMRTAPERREYLSSLSRGIRDRRAFAEVERYAMFGGYPRSGHSVIGSLLNAHPDMVVAHELNALRYVQAGFSRLQLFSLLLESDRKFEAHGRTWGRLPNSSTRDHAGHGRQRRGRPASSIRSGGARASTPSSRATPGRSGRVRMSAPDRTRGLKAPMLDASPRSHANRRV